MSQDYEIPVRTLARYGAQTDIEPQQVAATRQSPQYQDDESADDAALALLSPPAQAGHRRSLFRC